MELPSFLSLKLWVIQKTRSIRAKVVKAGQDTKASNFGRKN